MGQISQPGKQDPYIGAGQKLYSNEKFLFRKKYLQTSR